MLQEAVVLQGACNNNESTIAKREDATIKFYMLSIDRIKATSILVVSQEGTMMMVDCGKECKIAQATTNQIFMLQQGSEN